MSQELAFKILDILNSSSKTKVSQLLTLFSQEAPRIQAENEKLIKQNADLKEFVFEACGYVGTSDTVALEKWRKRVIAELV